MFHDDRRFPRPRRRSHNSSSPPLHHEAAWDYPRPSTAAQSPNGRDHWWLPPPQPPTKRVLSHSASAGPPWPPVEFLRPPPVHPPPPHWNDSGASSSFRDSIPPFVTLDEWWRPTAAHYRDPHVEVNAVVRESTIPAFSVPYRGEVVESVKLKPPLMAIAQPLQPPPKAKEAKTSRYLREIDRRNILARIDSGEKQSVLAKEFQVTRAAICNLKKHREAILSRVASNPFAKHPKKAKLRPTSTADGTKAAVNWRRNSLVFEVSSRPTSLLYRRLRELSTTAVDFRRVGSRLTSLLFEEAFAWVQTASYKRKVARRGTSHRSVKHEAFELLDVRGICGVAVHPDGLALLDAFQALEPDAPRGVVRFEQSADPSQLVMEDLPSELGMSHVYLVHAVVTVDRSAWIAEAVRILLSRGAIEERLCLVTLSIAAEAMAELQATFPVLKIVTARVDVGKEDEEQEEGEKPRAVDQIAVQVARDALAE